jgi:tight adherence protein B
MNQADLVKAAIAVFVFLAVALAVDGLLAWWRSQRSQGARRVRTRIDRMAGSANADPLEIVESVVRTRPLSHWPWLDQILVRMPVLAGTDRRLRQAGLDWTVGRFLGISLLAPLAVLMVGGILGLRAAPMLTFSLIALVLPTLVLNKLFETRLTRFDDQLPEALEILSRAMRSGYSLGGALKVAADELPTPLGPELAQTHDEITFGIAPQTALAALAERVPSADLRYMVIAILIQRETGGNLAEIFGKIASLMRDRNKLAGQVRTLSADGRMSAVVLCLLPLVTVGVVYIVNRQYIEVLWTTESGRKMLMFSAVMMSVGMLWIRQVIRVRF